MARWSNHNWRDVPMPPRVAALPRDRRGFPVPWVSEWSSPDGTPSKLTPEPFKAPIYTQDMVEQGFLIMPMAGCDHVIGTGIPDLGNLCTDSQIRGMRDSLCDVCGEKVDPPYYFMGDNSKYNPRIPEGKADPNGDSDPRHQLFRECPMHFDCAFYAAQVCPAMLRMRDSGMTAMVFRTESYNLMPMCVVFDRASDGDLPDQDDLVLPNFECLGGNVIEWHQEGKLVLLKGMYAELPDINSVDHLRVPDWVAAGGAL